jgi:hypothetical protein
MISALPLFAFGDRRLRLFPLLSRSAVRGLVLMYARVSLSRCFSSLSHAWMVSAKTVAGAASDYFRAYCFEK